MKYILSFECQIKHTYTDTPRWWEFWEEPVTTKKLVWTRMVTPITDSEYLALCTDSTTLRMMIAVLVRMTAATPEIRDIQVGATNPDSGCHVENTGAG